MMRVMPKFGSVLIVTDQFDQFDRRLLNLVQRNAAQTAEQLALEIALSPSAIARRLRRLRAEGWIGRIIALLSPRVAASHLRALVMVQLAEHADQRGKDRLRRRLLETDEVQLAYEVSGNHDLAVMMACPSMNHFVSLAEELFASDPVVRRYETSFVKREMKFAPFIDLGAA